MRYVLFLLLLPLFHQCQPTDRAVAVSQPAEAESSLDQPLEKTDPAALAAIAQQAQRFLEQTPAAQRAAVQFDFADTSRRYWHFFPKPLVARRGLQMSELNDAQREAVHRIMAASLSAHGYLKATGIMHLDEILNEYTGKTNMEWDTDNYWFHLYGTPDPAGTWAWKLEGHHVSLNFTFHEGRSWVTPMFLGSNPGTVRKEDWTGWRILGEEEDLGFLLLNAFDEEQRKRVIVSEEILKDLILLPGAGDRLQEKRGLPARDMTDRQRDLLLRVLQQYVDNVQYELAVEQLDRIEAGGFDDIYFSWVGPTDPAADSYYYALDGPNFTIEYDNFENHVHTVWHGRGSNYGDDVLEAHYRGERH